MPLQERIFSPLIKVWGYADGGFNISAPSSIYTMDDIVGVVNDYKRHLLCRDKFLTIRCRKNRYRLPALSVKRAKQPQDL